MTYEEIYDDIVENCWPGVGGNPPQNMPARIRTKVRSCHRMINRDFNFWFTLTSGTITTVAGQSVYDLPELYKEMERAYFTISGQTYGGPVLNQIDITDGLDRAYHTDDTQVEYPSSFMVNGSQIILYPAPSTTGYTLNLYYWTFLPVIDIDTQANFEANAEDDIALYCGEAIVAWVTSKIKLMQNEWQESELYLRDYNIFIEGAIQEDMHRRAIPHNRAPYTTEFYDD